MADVNQPGCGYGYGGYGGCYGGRRGFSTIFLIILLLLCFPTFFGGFGY